MFNYTISKLNDELFQKVHTFQASLEAVLAQLCNAEQEQKSLQAGASVNGSQPESSNDHIPEMLATWIQQ